MIRITSVLFVAFIFGCASGGAKLPVRHSVDASVHPDVWQTPSYDAAPSSADAFHPSDAHRTDAYSVPDPVSDPLACTAGHVGHHLHLETLPSIGACAGVWTIVLWGAGGRHEEYDSLPGHPLDVDIAADWGGWAAATAYCGSWDHVRPWETMTLPSVRAAGMTIEIDGYDASDEVLVCYDPGGGVYRPLIPIDCGLDPCPGPHY